MTTRTVLVSGLADTVERLRLLGNLAEQGEVVQIQRASGLDDAEASQASEQHEEVLAHRAVLLAKARRIADALRRLDAGEYGTCVDCDAPISPRRLEALPEADRCVACQDQQEREAARARRWRTRLEKDDDDEEVA